MKRAMLSIWVCVGVLFCLAGLTAYGEAPSSLSKEEEGKIEQEIRNRGIHGELYAERFVKHYGQRAVPFLLELLEKDDEQLARKAKSKVCLYLGKLGDVKAVPAIIAFLKAPLPADFTLDCRNDLLTAGYGLAFLDSDDARTFLREAMTDEYWLSRADLPTSGERSLDLEENRRDIRSGYSMFYTMNLWVCQGKEVTAPEHIDAVPADLRGDGLVSHLSYAKSNKVRMGENLKKEYREDEPITWLGD